MRVFISWSGDTSNQVAEALSRWLPMVLQQVKCFFSPKDIEKGARWALDLATQLEGASVGVLCLTRENLGAPWMLFEAGAMSRALQTSNVCPLLFGLEPNDVAGPLAQFQSSTFSKDEVRKLIQTINGKLESPLDATSLETIFEKWWPDLESAVQQLLARTPSSKPGPRPTAEVLDEVLSLVRSMSRHPSDRLELDLNKHHGILLFGTLKRLAEGALEIAKNAEQVAVLDQLRLVLETCREGFSVAFAAMGNLEIATKMRKDANRLHGLLEKRISELDDEIPF